MKTSEEHARAGIEWVENRHSNHLDIAMAQLHATLAIAAAIREQTEVFKMNGIRVHQDHES